jgi:hypothetical protein
VCRGHAEIQPDAELISEEWTRSDTAEMSEVGAEQSCRDHCPLFVALPVREIEHAVSPDRTAHSKAEWGPRSGLLLVAAGDQEGIANRDLKARLSQKAELLGRSSKRFLASTARAKNRRTPCCLPAATKSVPSQSVEMIGRNREQH